MAVQIQIRRGTAAAWTSANPTLAAGEFAIETDTDFYKIGDGSTAWTSLGYSSIPSGTATLASPTFTGVPAAPTAAANTSTTQIATTAFVMTEVGDYAPLASPTFTGTVTVPDLTVNGTTTTINSTTLTVDDKNLELGSVATPSDTTADGGGITLKGASDKTITWTNSTDTWDFNQGITVTGTATATAFSGPLTGNVTGNASGTAATVTGAAQSAITSVGTLTGVTVGGTATMDVGIQKAVSIAVETGSAFTLALSHAGKLVSLGLGANQAITVPPNSSVAFPIGTQIAFFDEQTGGVNTFVQGSGVTIRSKDSNKVMDGDWTTVVLIKQATDIWYLFGPLTS